MASCPPAQKSFGSCENWGRDRRFTSNVADGQRLATSDGIGSFVVHYSEASPFDHTLVIVTSFLPAVAGDYNLNGVDDQADFVAGETAGRCKMKL